MPIYEYECTKCGHVSEVWQKFSDPPVVQCDLCHGKMKKLVSQSAFHLKGTGWYVTDYASKSGGGKAKDSSPPKETSKGETKSGAGSSAAKKESSDS